MARVFVSYASPDAYRAIPIAAQLEAGHNQVFLDRDVGDGIQVGEDWKQRLHAELRRADAVVALISAASVRSPWCAAEIAIADTMGCRILPVRLDAGVRNPLIESLQYVDHAADPVRAMEVLTQNLRALTTTVSTPDGTLNPFPGLTAFTAAQAAYFHGRETDVRYLTNRLRAAARAGDGGLLAVVGPSGCGKSSLLAAGLVHRMARADGWLCLPICVPGGDPVRSLARAISEAGSALGTGWSVAQVRTRLDEEPDALTQLIEELIDADLRIGQERVLLPLDQAEELFTRAGADAREQLGELFKVGLGGSLHVVMTLRSEFLDDLTRLPALTGVPIDAHVLAPLGAQLLREVVEAPARVAGLHLEPELAPRLVEDTGSGEALPLLAFTLHELAEGLEPGDELTVARYEELGGVQGSLARHAAEACRTAMARSGLSQDEVVAGLVRLVTVDGSGRRARRRVRWDRLPESVQQALRELVEQRLLVTGGDEDGAWVGVAHEALLTAWRPLDSAVGRLTVALAAAREVEQAADQWRSAGSQNGYLWDGDRLRAARTVLAIGGTSIDLDADGAAFLEASQRRAEQLDARELRRRRWTTVSLSLLLVFALAAAALGFGLRSSSQTAERRAVASDLLSRAKVQAPINTWLAMRLAVASQHLDNTRASENLLLNLINFSPFSSVLDGPQSPVWSVAFSPDGNTLATAENNGTVILWNVSNRESPEMIGGPRVAHTDAVYSVAFAPDGLTMVTGSFDGSALIWDVRDVQRPTVIAPLIDVGSGQPGSVASVGYRSDSRVVVTAGFDGKVFLWDISNPMTPSQLGGPLMHGSSVNSTTFVNENRTLASVGDDGALRLWDVSDPAAAASIGQPVHEHDGSALVVRADPFRPGIIATAGVDGATVLWDVGQPDRPTRLGVSPTTRRYGIADVAFLPFELEPRPDQGKPSTLAIAVGDGTVELWDVTDLDGPALQYSDRFPGHTGSVTAVAFSTDGSMVTGSFDRKAILWRPIRSQRAGDVVVGPDRSGDPPPVAIGWGGFTADGGTYLTGSEDGAVRSWPLPAQGAASVPMRGSGHEGAINAGAVARDRPLLATGGDDTTARLWTLAPQSGPSPIGGPLTGHSDSVDAVALSPDGTLLVTGGADGSVILWDVSDPSKPARVGPPLARSTKYGVSALAITPDGTSLIIATGDGLLNAVGVGDPAQAIEVGQLPGRHDDVVKRISIRPDGKIMATVGADARVIMWDISDPATVGMLGDFTAHAGDVLAAAFTQSGETMVTTGSEGSVKLWDVQDPARPELLGDLPASGDQPTAASVGAGDVLGIGTSAGHIDFFRLAGLGRSRDALSAVACGRAGGSLDGDDWELYAGGLKYEDACAGG